MRRGAVDSTVDGRQGPPHEPAGPPVSTAISASIACPRTESAASACRTAQSCSRISSQLISWVTNATDDHRTSRSCVCVFTPELKKSARQLMQNKPRLAC